MQKSYMSDFFDFAKRDSTIVFDFALLINHIKIFISSRIERAKTKKCRSVGLVIHWVKGFSTS